MPQTRVGDSAISRALHFLRHSQTTSTDEARLRSDWAGNWPHYLVARDALMHLPAAEVAPGLAAYVHDGLAVVHENNAEALGLTADDCRHARSMRTAAADFMRRFETPTPGGRGGSFGWWPRRARPPSWLAARMGDVAAALFRGPRLCGPLAPLNVPTYPLVFQLWPDADDTAMVYVALERDARLDGGEPPPRPLAPLFENWLDDGHLARGFPKWLAPKSSAFLTWMEHPPDPRIRNDVDLGANANVLHALAIYGEPGAPGAAASSDMIVQAVRQGRHHPTQAVSLYYPDNLMFHFLVARAYRDGPVPALAPAVEILADEVESAAILGPDGSVRWGERESHLQTAYAVLVLLHAGRVRPLVAGGVRTLLETQSTTDGGWPEAVLCEGRTASGHLITWRSRAGPTATVLTALCRAWLSGIRRF